MSFRDKSHPVLPGFATFPIGTVFPFPAVSNFWPWLPPACVDSHRRSCYRAIMLRKLYDWTFSLAARKTAEVWLGVIAFIESSVFLIPADVLFLPMALARPDKAYRYALIATVASTLGGIAGYLLGAYAFDAIARPVLQFYGKLDAFNSLKACAGIETTLIFLVTSGLAHLPPIKVVTILSGVLQVGLPLFIAACLDFPRRALFCLGVGLEALGRADQGVRRQALGPDCRRWRRLS